MHPRGCSRDRCFVWGCTFLPVETLAPLNTLCGGAHLWPTCERHLREWMKDQMLV